MKKYKLTIEYNDISEEIISIEEEFTEPEKQPNINEDDIAKLTTQDILKIMFFKDYGKA